MKQILLGQDAYVGAWVAERVKCEFNQTDKAIGLLSSSGELIAGVLYQNFNGVNIAAHIAVSQAGHALTPSFLWVIFDYPFNQLCVKRITGFVPASNVAARKFDETLGFVREATLEDALPDGDLIIYVMRPENCRWLRLKERLHGHGIQCVG